jgi:hypothetical protein
MPLFVSVILQEFQIQYHVPQSTYYIDYHIVCPLVRIGTPHPLYRERVCPPRTNYRGAHSPTGEG